MKLKVGSKYKLVVSVGGQILTFNCVVDEIYDNFISFTDKYGRRYNYNQNVIISYEEVNNEE